MKVSIIHSLVGMSLQKTIQIGSGEGEYLSGAFFFRIEPICMSMLLHVVGTSIR
jgi:hypothetical protein